MADPPSSPPAVPTDDPAYSAGGDNDAHVSAVIEELAIGDYLSPELARLAAAAKQLHERRTISDATRRRYETEIKLYEAFCDRLGLDADVPGSVALYITARVTPAPDAPPPQPDVAPVVTEPRKRGRPRREPKPPRPPKPDVQNTLRARRSALRYRAAIRGIPNPFDNEHVRQITGNAQRQIRKDVRRVDAARYEFLPQLVSAANGPMRLRDRALILLGFAIGKRGTELAAIDIEHITSYSNGIVIRIPKTKTNQTGKSEYLGVPRFPDDPFCPVTALEDWVKSARIRSGPVFITFSPIAGEGGNRMSYRDISRRLEALAKAADLDGFWRSHSLRRGMVTSAEKRNIARSRTRILTGWKSDAMFASYADHTSSLIDSSPMHEIFAQRADTLPVAHLVALPFARAIAENDERDA